MIAKRAHLIGWMLICAVTLLSFVMDHFRMLIWHFNWFMVILFITTTVLVGVIVYLGRLAGSQGVGDTKNTPSKN